MTASDIAIIIGAVFAGLMAIAQWYSNYQLAKIKATSEAALESSKRNTANIKEVSDKAESAVSHAATAAEHAAVAVTTAQASADRASDKINAVAVAIDGRMEQLQNAAFAAGVQSERDKK